MGRDIRGHADSNTARTIDQHIGEACGKNRGFLLLAIVIVLKIDGVLVDIGQQEGGRLVHADFGIAHRGGVIAIHGAEIALTIQERQRHRERLRHAHKRVIDRAIAMRVVLTHHIANRTGRFAIGFFMGVIGLMHREKDAAVNRFETVPQIGNRA